MFGFSIVARFPTFPLASHTGTSIICVLTVDSIGTQVSSVLEKDTEIRTGNGELEDIFSDSFSENHQTGSAVEGVEGGAWQATQEKTKVNLTSYRSSTKEPPDMREAGARGGPGPGGSLQGSR